MDLFLLGQKHRRPAGTGHDAAIPEGFSGVASSVCGERAHRTAGPRPHAPPKVFFSLSGMTRVADSGVKEIQTSTGEFHRQHSAIGAACVNFLTEPFSLLTRF